MEDLPDVDGRLADIKSAEQFEERMRDAECDWNDPDDLAFWKKGKYWDARLKLLDKVVPKRVCPLCRGVKTNLRAWVVVTELSFAACRSCYFRMINTSRPKEKQIIEGHIFEEQTTYTIDGKKLKEAREASGLSQAEFARQAEWSRSYIWQIEDGRRESVRVDAELRLRMLEVLSGRGVVCPDMVDLEREIVDEAQ